MCIYIYTCMYMCVNIYIYIHIHTYLQMLQDSCYAVNFFLHYHFKHTLHLLVNMYACSTSLCYFLIHMCIYIYIYTYMYIHTYIYTNISIHTISRHAHSRGGKMAHA